MYELARKYIRRAIGDRRQGEFAELIGMSSENLSRLLSGKIKASDKNIKAIAENSADTQITYELLLNSYKFISAKDIEIKDGLYQGCAVELEQQEILKKQFLLHMAHFDYMSVEIIQNRERRIRQIMRIDNIVKGDEDIFIIEKLEPYTCVDKNTIKEILKDRKKVKEAKIAFMAIPFGTLTYIRFGYVREINLCTYHIEAENLEYEISFYNRISDESSNIYRDNTIIE